MDGHNHSLFRGDSWSFPVSRRSGEGVGAHLARGEHAPTHHCGAPPSLAPQPPSADSHTGPAARPLPPLTTHQGGIADIQAILRSTTGDGQSGEAMAAEVRRNTKRASTHAVPGTERLAGGRSN
jgi:hypothetical protein